MNQPLDFVALARLGAYGVCILMIFYTSYQNSALIKSAGKLAPEKLRALQKHLQRIAWTGIALLCVAGVIDAVNRLYIDQRPITLNVQLQPGDFSNTARRLPELIDVADPLLQLQILGDLHSNYEFVGGQLQATVTHGQTISFDIHKVSEALLISSEKLKVANGRLASTEAFGASEPGQ